MPTNNTKGAIMVEDLCDIGWSPSARKGFLGVYSTGSAYAVT